MKSLILVEDDERLAELVSQYLTASGFSVTRFADGKGAQSAAQSIRAVHAAWQHDAPGVEGSQQLGLVRLQAARVAELQLRWVGEVTIHPCHTRT